MSRDSDQGEKREVSPIVLIVAGVVVAVLLVFFAIRFMAPHPETVYIPPASMQSEGAIKRRNIEKGKQSGAVQPAAGDVKSSDRAGD